MTRKIQVSNMLNNSSMFQPELTAKMIRLANSSGYHGWYGTESSGRNAIKKGKELLTKSISGK